MARRIAAGMLRHTVSLQTQSTVADSFGQLSSTAWGTNKSGLRAHIEVLSGSELELARQLYTQASHRVTIEYLPTLDTTGITHRRFLFGSRYLYIGHINNPEFENRHLEILCGEER